MHTAHCCVRHTTPLPPSLDVVFSPHRLQTYIAAAHGDEDLARALYVWNRDLSVAFLADIAILEVALRNAINFGLTFKWGDRWYEAGPILDKRCTGQLVSAWDRLSGPSRSNRADPALPGRLVSTLMFGFWTNLLDEGGAVGRSPRDERADHDALWLEIRRGFRGARAEARAAGVRYERSFVFTTVKNVNELRNRAAHHEAFINGFPLSGQRRRMSTADGYAECLKLARMLNRDLASWLEQNSDVPHLLNHRPPQLPPTLKCSSSPHLLVDGYPDF